MLSARSLGVGVSTLGLVIAMATVGYAVDMTKVKLYPDKKGTIADLQPMSKFCGTKPIKVALADGWGGNYWRHITRAEFEDEASKCKNITDARYTDGEFKPEKAIADIEGLIAQKYDVIVTFLDGGPAILKATREATAAGVAVVPYDTGDKFPGTIGKDYLDRATESQSEVGEQAAEWLVKTLNGKGNIIMFGGTPGNPMTEAQTHGWRPVFAKYPGIKVIVHPECRFEVCQKADAMGSTERLIALVEQAPAGQIFAVGTEIHLVNRMARRFAEQGKKVITLDDTGCLCTTMYRISPQHLAWVLENLVEGRVVNRIQVKPSVNHWAKVALDRMLEVR